MTSGKFIYTQICTQIFEMNRIQFNLVYFKSGILIEN